VEREKKSCWPLAAARLQQQPAAPPRAAAHTASSAAGGRPVSASSASKIARLDARHAYNGTCRMGRLRMRSSRASHVACRMPQSQAGIAGHGPPVAAPRPAGRRPMMRLLGWMRPGLALR
jgi:hypothetical protein